MYFTLTKNKKQILLCMHVLQLNQKKYINCSLHACTSLKVKKKIQKVFFMNVFHLNQK